MKNSIIALFILFAIPTHSQWGQQISGTNESLNDVFCITEDIVVVVGDNGTILKTTNGGSTWQSKISGTTANLIKIQFPTATTGYAIGSQASSGVGILLKTTDGGENWSAINLSDMSIIVDISCINDNVLFLNGNGINNFKLLKSINGGLTFEIVSTDTISGNKIQFLNEQIGYSSSSTQILKTTDGGVTWTEKNNSTIHSFFFLNENTGFINTNNGLYKTIDAFVNYSYLNTFNSIQNKLFATTENVVWGVPVECPLNGSPCYSFKGQIVSDGSFEITVGQPFRSIHFANPTTGYATACCGEIYKNITGNMLGFMGFDNKKIIKIYPNPSSDEVTVSFDEMTTQKVTIQIIDILGKIISTQDYLNENNIIINTKLMSKGVYFLTVINQDKRQTQKLIAN